MKYNNKEKALIYQINCIEIVEGLISNIEVLIIDNHSNKELITTLSVIIKKLERLQIFLETVQLKTAINISKEAFLLFEKDPSLSKVIIVVNNSKRNENPIPGFKRIVI